MMKIILVGTNEGSFDYNRNLDFQSIKDEEIQIQLHPEMLFLEGNDIVSVMLFTRFLLKKEEILKYSVTLHFKVENWTEFVKEKTDNEVRSTEEIHRMLGIIVGFLRGSLSLQERTTPLKGAFLPLVDIQRLSMDMNINRKSESRDSSGKKDERIS